MLYDILKVVHILSVVAWLGGAAALSAIVAMLVAARDRATVAALLPRARHFGRRIGAPAAILVLVSGMAMLRVAGAPARSLWVMWGLVGIAVHFAYTATVLRSRTGALARVAADASSADAALISAGSALRAAHVIYVLLMASVIAVMVLKP